MKYTLLNKSFALLTILLCSFSNPEWIKSQTPETNKQITNKLNSKPANLFPKEDLMKIGVFYYPEQWPHNEWERDFKNIASFGFDFTHLAEFSWALLEPEEGKYDFSWLDEAIDMASKAGLKIILCTPSLCPPAWMGDKFPEVYLVGSEGRRREHGNRANASLANSVYQSFTDKIVSAMASHYAKDNRIWGWQIDNEPLAVADYSPSSRDAFRMWLKKKYGTIEKLNDAWVGSFWSTKYFSFDQVLIPNESLAIEDRLSPHALLDFQRFTADVTAGFLNRQADLLRKFILPQQWITTNYINVSISADPRKSDHLDFPTFTMYPVSGKNELGGNNFRTGIPYRIYEACDYYRPIKGVTGLMELQPGQVNWGSVNPQLLPGTVHMWIMQAFGGGCSFLCTYRYRHPLRGSEMYHEGIVGTDGVTLSQGGKEYVQAIREIKELRQHYDANAKMPAELSNRRTAILWNHENMWDLDIQKQTSLWNTWRNRNNYTSAVKSTGASMDFISEDDDFSAYPFIIAPSYQLIDNILLNRWIDYVKNGGNLILSSRSGQKDRNGHFFEAAWAAPLKPLIGADLDFFDMLVADTTGTVTSGKMTFKWNIWAEILSPAPGTEVLASFTDQYYAGKAAAVTRKIGKGSITYIGVATQDGKLERYLVREVYKRANVVIEDLPRGVYHEWRDGFNIEVNYTDKPVDATLKEESIILTGSSPLKTASVIVWKNK
jgi:beta-galactosidase